MISNELYDLAIRFRRTKLWEKMYDTQLFAVKHSDGSIGYCCVMGANGEHFALAVYPGDLGMYSYRLMGIDRSGLDDLDISELAYSQNCVMVSYQSKDELKPRELAELKHYVASSGVSFRGKNAFPQFQRFRPHYFPWYLDDEVDQLHLKEALEAALEVAGRLTLTTPEDIGFTEGAPYDRKIPALEKVGDEFVFGHVDLPEPVELSYKSPEIRDDIALRKLSKAKSTPIEWACEIFMIPDPVAQGDDEYVDEPLEAPIFPYMLFIANNNTSFVISTQVSGDADDYSECFMRAAIGAAISGGKPTKIFVCNDRTYSLFKVLAAQLGAKLVLKRSLPVVDDIRSGFIESFENRDGDQMEQIMEILQDPAALSELPNEMMIQLKQLLGAGALPESVERNVLRELKKRGIK